MIQLLAEPPAEGSAAEIIGPGSVARAHKPALGQSVSIMAGSQATLSFVMRIRWVSSPFTDVLNVKVDGTITELPEPAQREVAYSLRTIDLSAFADGPRTPFCSNMSGRPLARAAMSWMMSL